MTLWQAGRHLLLPKRVSVYFNLRPSFFAVICYTKNNIQRRLNITQIALQSKVHAPDINDYQVEGRQF
jgi:hypothetical protein